MTAGWVAGSVRGRLLTRRRLGRAGARDVAAAGSAEAAVALLADSPYRRDIGPGMPPAAARRAIAATSLWHLRVLAGWLPPRGGDVVRVLAGCFELENIADRLVALAGRSTPEPYPLGTLGAVWPRLAEVGTPRAARAALAGSAWGDPGTGDWPAAAAPLAARWASRLADAVPEPDAWAAGAAALVVARAVAAGDPVPPTAAPDLRRVLGPGWARARDLTDLPATLPARAAWVLDGVEDPGGLWRAEGRWWRRVDRDAAAVLRAARPGPAVAAAAAARLVADARRAQGALAAAAWGQPGIEAFDAVA